MIEEKSRYITGMLLSAGANLLGMAASLITIMVAARVLTKEQLGAFFLVFMVTQLASVLGDFGMRNTAIQKLSKINEMELKAISRFFFTISLLSSIFVLIAVVVILPLLYRIWPYTEFERHAWYGAPIAFLMINFQMASSLLIGARRFGVLSAVNGGIEISRAVLSVSFLLAGFGIAGLLWSLIFSRIIGIGLIWLSIPSQFGIKFRHPNSQEMLKFGGWLYGASVISVITQRTADILLASLLGPAALAIYSTAMQLPRTLQRVFESIRPVLLGYVSSKVHSGASLLISESRVISGMLAVGATFLIAFSEPLLTLLYSQNYISGVDIMRVLSFWIAVSIVSYYLILSLIGKGRARAAFIFTLPQLLLMLLSTVLLVPQFKGVGAAVALAVTALSGNVIACHLLAAKDSSLFRILISTLLRAFVPPGLMCLIVILINDTFLINIALLVATIGILFMLGAITSNDIKNIAFAIIQSINRRSNTGNAYYEGTNIDIPPHRSELWWSSDTDRSNNKRP
jgi:O-antigen/teichoic acid export membrane protein